MMKYNDILANLLTQHHVSVQNTAYLERKNILNVDISYIEIIELLIRYHGDRLNITCILRA